MSAHPVFSEPDPRRKLAQLAGAVALARHSGGAIPIEVARHAQVLPIRELPTRAGLASREGLARLLHDLANIELQATELALRTLVEFRDLPPALRAELETLTMEEGEHLALCLDGLSRLGFRFGHWPIHTQLWKSVRTEDSLLDRLLIVHRYQEGGGLDAGATLQAKLTGVGSKEPLVQEALAVVRGCLDIIFHDELGHVQFGSRWYRQIFQQRPAEREPQATRPEQDFVLRLRRLMPRMPLRRERIGWELRLRAGFDPEELAELENIRKPMTATEVSRV